MTPRMAAIFGAETTSVIAPVVADPPVDDPFPSMADGPTELIAGDSAIARPVLPWPIIEGSEHFSLYVRLYVDPDARHWPEFVPGLHYDVRQPSRLRGLCSPIGEDQQR